MHCWKIYDFADLTKIFCEFFYFHLKIFYANCHLYKLLSMQNVTYTKCYLYELLPMQNVTYTKCYYAKVYYTLCYGSKISTTLWHLLRFRWSWWSEAYAVCGFSDPSSESRRCTQLSADFSVLHENVMDYFLQCNDAVFDTPQRFGSFCS